MTNEATHIPVVKNSLFVEHYFFLYTSSNFLQDLTKRLMTLERFVRDIQHLKQIWIKPLKNSLYYEMLLPEAILICSMSEHGIDINGIYDRNIRDNVQFLREGVAISLKKDVIVINHTIIQNKQFEVNCRHDEYMMKNTIKEIESLFIPTDETDFSSKLDNSYKTYEIKFENWLILYEESMLQHLESQITSHPQIKYKKIALDTMFGPFTISFFIDSILPIPLKYGHLFYIKLLSGEWVNGSLVERYVDNDMNIVVITFDRLIALNKISKQGNLFFNFEEMSHIKQKFHSYFRQLNTLNPLNALLTNNVQRGETTSISVPLHILSKYQLDNEQLEIAKKAIESHHIFYIDGVIATGKSKILQFIREYYETINERVLYITSNDNASQIDSDSVVTLPQKIAEIKYETMAAVEKLEEAIIADKRVITSYASDLMDLNLSEQEYEKHKVNLKQFYDNLKSNYIVPMNKCYEQFLANEQKLNEWYTKITTDEQKLMELMERGEFKKWIIMPLIVSQQASYKKRHNKYTELLNRQQFISATYNDSAQKVNIILNDEQLKIKKETLLMQQKHIEVLKARLAESFHLSSIYKSEIHYENEKYTVDDIYKITNQLERLHQSIKQFKRSISNPNEHLIISILSKKLTTLRVSMKMLHNYYSLFTNAYDTILIDDAHTYTALELFIAISLGKKVIITGNQKQQSVNVANKSYIHDILNSEPRLFRESTALTLFKLLPNSAKGQLNILYRLMPSLTSLYHEVIFSKDVVIKNKTEVRILETLPNIVNPILMLTTSQTQNRYESDIVGYGIYNHCEAIAIVDIVVAMLKSTEQLKTYEPQSEFVQEKLTPDDILISSFFDMQIEYIRTHIRYAFPELNKETIDKMVQPLSNCIGIERKIVFISLCASNKLANHERYLSQLRQANLWNIALSRATHQLIIIGDVDYIRNSTNLERRHDKFEQYKYEWSSFDVANVIKTMVKIAMSGEIQFVSLENFSKQLVQVNGGFGYE